MPVFGEVFDAINSLWYAAEGDFVNAALSFAAIVPVFGMAATGAKWGYKIFKSIKVSERVAEVINTGRKYAKTVLTAKKRGSVSIELLVGGKKIAAKLENIGIKLEGKLKNITSKRLQYMGNTPRKTSKTGREVI